MAILFFDKDWAPRFPLATATDAKLKDMAEEESRLYSVCGASKCDENSRFHFLFSFPCTMKCIQMEMHLIVSGRLHFIKIYKAQLIIDARNFFILMYGLIRWTYKHDKERCSSKPTGVVPKKGFGVVYKDCRFKLHPFPEGD